MSFFDEDNESSYWRLGTPEYEYGPPNSSEITYTYHFGAPGINSSKSNDKDDKTKMLGNSIQTMNSHNENYNSKWSNINNSLENSEHNLSDSHNQTGNITIHNSGSGNQIHLVPPIGRRRVGHESSQQQQQRQQPQQQSQQFSIVLSP